MERITVSGPDGGWTIPEGRQEEAARRLAAFENAAQRLARRHGELAGFIIIGLYLTAKKKFIKIFILCRYRFMAF